MTLKTTSLFNIYYLIINYKTKAVYLNDVKMDSYFESTKSIREFNTQIDLSGYSKDIYNLTIRTSDGISNHILILQ